MVGSAELRKREDENRTGGAEDVSVFGQHRKFLPHARKTSGTQGTPTFRVPFPFASFPLSESLEQASQGGEMVAAVTFLQLFRDFDYWPLGSTVHFISE